jgi:hypothetical protein
MPRARRVCRLGVPRLQASTVGDISASSSYRTDSGIGLVSFTPTSAGAGVNASRK